jgi:hypothetical protein
VSDLVFHRCMVCPQLISTRESYCLRHRPKRDTRRGSGAAQRSFRAGAMQQAGGQCEAEVDGVRCVERRPELLEAHHLRPVSEGGTSDLHNAVVLCVEHHRQWHETHRQRHAADRDERLYS